MSRQGVEVGWDECRRVRTALGLSQSELARVLGVTDAKQWEAPPPRHASRPSGVAGFLLLALTRVISGDDDPAARVVGREAMQAAASGGVLASIRVLIDFVEEKP